jgi:hypothetical protein
MGPSTSDALDGEDSPRLGDTLETVFTSVDECNAGSEDEHFPL